jgi:hypothetical protein
LALIQAEMARGSRSELSERANPNMERISLSTHQTPLLVVGRGIIGRG